MKLQWLLSALITFAVPYGYAAPARIDEGLSFCKSQAGAVCGDAAKAQTNVQEVGSVNGVSYRFTHWGEAVIQASPSSEIETQTPSNVWHIKCSRDVLTGSRSCMAFNSATLTFLANSEGVEVFSVGYEHFPGSQSSLRVGTKVFNTKLKGGMLPQAKAIIAELKDGRPFATRYMRWPKEQWLEAEGELYGAQLTIELARWLAKNAK